VERMKVIDIINQRIQDGTVPMFSFEYFPPKTEKGVENLYERLDTMSAFGPAWIDVTWGAGGSTSNLTQEICGTCQKLLGLETMMHLTCTNISKEEIKKELQKAKDNGIKNILALRGDPPRGEEWKKKENGFSYAVDLIKFIKEEYGNYFGICVAGYPEKHIDSLSYEEDLLNLKKKIDAGGDVIITQLFYDTDIFFKFVKDCNSIGIKCPIIPGIMPIHTYSSFERMTNLCKTFVPKFIKDDLEPIKHDDEAVKNYGIDLSIKICKILISSGIKYLHFYTLNLEKSIFLILKGLGLIDNEIRRSLPWNSIPSRSKEDVRPIYWAHRPKSYIHRTASWDDYPNGRWGDSRSPAFGDLTDYHLSNLHITKSFEKLNAWCQNPIEFQDIFNVFSNYCSGEIEKLPWCDTPLLPESDSIKENLIKINKQGFLTINSQPKVNGLPSNDIKVGWGPKGGYVYQKAYIEFFTSPEKLKLMQNIMKQFPSINYMAINNKGELLSNMIVPSVSAVTWGVFPGREIVQPTVADTESFKVWKDEAFALWRSNWLIMYQEGSKSFKLLETMITSYYLVALLDNNYIDGDIFILFEEVMKQKI